MLIGIAGRAGSGKTTAAHYLETAKKFKRRSFAAPLKLALIAMGVPDEFVYGERKGDPCPQLCGVTARHAMQTLGTEWGRNLIHGDLWVKLMEDALAVETADVVIDDVRFPNEVAMIKRRYGTVVWLSRGADNVGTHASENMSPNDADYFIVNDGTFGTLYRYMDRLIDEIDARSDEADDLLRRYEALRCFAETQNVTPSGGYTKEGHAAQWECAECGAVMDHDKYEYASGKFEHKEGCRLK